MSQDTLIASSQDASFLDLMTDNTKDLIAQAAKSSYRWLLESEEEKQAQLFWMPTYLQQISEAPRYATETISYFTNLSEQYADNSEKAALLQSAPERVFALAFQHKAMTMDNPEYNLTCDGQKNMNELLQTIRDTAHTLVTLGDNRPTTDTTDRLLNLGDYAATQAFHYLQMLSANPV